MREISCLNCGKKVIDYGNRQNKKFCSKRCQSGYWNREMKHQKTVRSEMLCIYNEGVDCQEHKCGSCGWNPAVAKRREEMFK